MSKSPSNSGTQSTSSAILCRNLQLVTNKLTYQQHPCESESQWCWLNLHLPNTRHILLCLQDVQLQAYYLVSDIPLTHYFCCLTFWQSSTRYVHFAQHYQILIILWSVSRCTILMAQAFLVPQLSSSFIPTILETLTSELQWKLCTFPPSTASCQLGPREEENWRKQRMVKRHCFYLLLWLNEC